MKAGESSYHISVSHHNGIFRHHSVPPLTSVELLADL